MAYDDREAKQLLATRAEEVAPSTNAREKAAHLLLDALTKLNGTAGTRIESVGGGDTTVVMVLKTGAQKQAWVTWEGERFTVDLFVVQAGKAGKPQDVTGLRFDRLAGEFVSDEEDARLAPKPGEPKPRRSALAVLVEAAIRALAA